MVKFLLEHALALDEKVENLPNPWPGSSETSTDMIAESTHLERSRVTQSIITEMQNFEHFG